MLTNKNGEYSFLLKGINLLSKSMTPISQKPKKAQFEFDVAIDISLLPEKNQTVHIFSVEVYNKGAGRVLAGSLIVEYTFEIANFTNVIVGGNIAEDLLFLLRVC